MTVRAQASPSVAPSAHAGVARVPVALDSARSARDWLAAQGVRRLVSDSRQLKAGDAFLAWPGEHSDARGFLGQAADAGARAALMEAEGARPFMADCTLPVATLAHLKEQAGALADLWWDQPTQHMDVLAVTGTNGKTSTSWWLAQSLQSLGRSCGVAGTLGVGVLPHLQDTGLTTADPLALQSAFAQMRAQGVGACAIEASSIGLVEGRLQGTRIAVALLSNFTQDHLDYHGSMQAYWAAKRRLFAWQGLRAAVVNVDDDQGAVLAAELGAQRTANPAHADLWTVSSTSGRSARLVAASVVHAPSGLSFVVEEFAGGPSAVDSAPVATSLIGGFNVDNLLLVLGGLRALGVPLQAAAKALAALTPVPGRLQRLTSAASPAASELPEVVVDYAHTPDALRKALQTLRPWAVQRKGRLWCVFGCGGDRDPGKRPLMGAIAAELADEVVLTSDNPRSEAPQAILLQVEAGIAPALRGHLEMQIDRRLAIASAVRRAAPADVVLLAGKGHEDYQEIEGQRLPFSDVSVARDHLQLRARAEGLST